MIGMRYSTAIVLIRDREIFEILYVRKNASCNIAQKRHRIRVAGGERDPKKAVFWLKSGESEPVYTSKQVEKWGIFSTRTNVLQKWWGVKASLHE